MGVKCQNCGCEIPEEASFCMHCFTPTIAKREHETELKKKNKKIFLFFPIIIILCIFVAISAVCMANGNGQKDEINSSARSTIASSTGEKSTTTTKATEKSTAEKTKEKSTTTATTTATTTQVTAPPVQSVENEAPATKATTSPYGSFTYSSYGNGIRITKYSGNESNITIPDKIDGKVILGISENAFCNNPNIKSIVFESSSKSNTITISPNAFCNLASLKKISFSCKTECSDFATCISKCNKLESVYIPNDSSAGGYYSSNGVVYRHNNDSTDTLIMYPAGKENVSFKIPNNVSAIGDNSFCANKHLKKIQFSKRENVNANWKNLFSKSNLPELKAILIYPGTNADIDGIQYFRGDIEYYE